MQVIDPINEKFFKRANPTLSKDLNLEKAEVYRQSVRSRWDDLNYRTKFLETLDANSPQKKLLISSGILSNIIQLFPEKDRNFWTLILTICAPEIIHTEDPRRAQSIEELINAIYHSRENNEEETRRMLTRYFAVVKIKDKQQTIFFKHTMESYRSLFLTMATSLLLNQVELEFSPDSASARNSTLFNPLYMRRGMQTYHDHLKLFASDEWLEKFYSLIAEVNTKGHCPELDQIIALADHDNNPIAQHYLSRIFFDGHLDVEVNTKKGIDYMKRSAKQGYALAQDDYAMKLMEGNGVKKNIRLYRKYLKRGAASGYVKSQYHLGVSYSKGIGCRVNHLKALKWFSLAANNTYFSSGEEETIMLARNNVQLLQEGFDEPTLRAAAKRASTGRANKIAGIVVNVFILIISVFTIAVVVGLLASIILI